MSKYKGTIQLKTVCDSRTMYLLLIEIDLMNLKGLTFDFNTENFPFQPKNYSIVFESKYKKYMNELIKFIEKFDQEIK